MTKDSSIAVLVSGGLDSGVLVAELAGRYDRVWPIYIRQGLVWESAELYWLRRYIRKVHSRCLRPLEVLSLPMADLYGDHWSTGNKHVPGARTPDRAVYLAGRNMALSLKAAIFCGLHKIPQLALGSLAHNPFSDATPRFLNQWGKVLGRGLQARLKVAAPYRRWSKTKVVRLGQHWPLHLTFSCIAPQNRRHCGRCNKCAERRRAFRAAGVKDCTRYAIS